MNTSSGHPGGLRIWRSWFTLTLQERLVLGGILAIFLIGLTARYYHLKHQRPEPFQPEGINRVEERIAHEQ